MPSEEYNLVEVTVAPNEFENNKCSLSCLRGKWFTNLSSVSIPECVQCFLQLGGNFSLPICYNSKLIFELIKNIEFNIKKLQTSVHNSVRNNSIAIINSLFSLKQKKNFVIKILQKATRLTKQFLKDNSNIIFTKADRGNLTVALDKNMYIEKVKTMLDDKDMKILKDPTSKINSNLRQLLISGQLKNLYDIDMTANAVEKRWLSLRDMFSRESRKKLLPSGSGYQPKKEWELYKMMLFLSPHIAHRRLVLHGCDYIITFYLIFFIVKLFLEQKRHYHAD
ncbi:hypothetical protein ALC57_07766 [Trachymyrmex cornetzi]|uniref:MADF domain-containing protein n=1 Tax=Trachymyrmex cornetzi TaxID=471704 RepID=A0A195E482_9HYME|nr:hypothetical protein ALC57_07766 [Trachymyrmex cornetzi]